MIVTNSFYLYVNCYNFQCIEQKSILSTRKATVRRNTLRS